MVLLALGFLAMSANAAPAAESSSAPVTASASVQSSSEKPGTQASALHETTRVHSRMAARQHHHSVTNVHYRRVYSRRRHRYYERFTGNSFATDQTEGDVTDGESRRGGNAHW